MKFILKSIIFISITFSLGSCGILNFPMSGGQPSGGGQGGGYGRSAERGVTVRNIRLTKDYTILSLRYNDRNQPFIDDNGRQGVTGTIAFRNDAVLIAANGARRFRVMKMDGIPTYPKMGNLYGGEQVDFVVYFERLDKGLENFDLFECNDFDQLVCWNIYNLYIKNPADVVVPQPQPKTIPTTVPPVNTPTDLPTKTGKGETPTKPVPVVVAEPVILPVQISGTVKDAKSGRPLSATIDFKVSNSKVNLDSVQSFASTGAYKMALTKGQVYTIVSSAYGYLPVSETIDLTKAKSGQKITKDIALTPLSVGDKITLKNIYFEMSKSDLLAASFSELDRVVTMMQDNPTLAIRLEGHTDIVGDKDLNLQLSQERVKACQQYLVKKGIQSGRIEAVGYGDTRPIVTKGTDEDRKVNRRVEFLILKL